MRVAVTGASGLIGSALVPVLEEAGHEVVSLVRGRAPEVGEASWDPAAGTIDVAALQGVDAIVHLAGENIGQRWTETVRKRILDSRVEGTRLVAETAAALDPKPALLAASAIGLYGQQGDQELTEGAPRGEGFLGRRRLGLGRRRRSPRARPVSVSCSSGRASCSRKRAARSAGCCSRSGWALAVASGAVASGGAGWRSTTSQPHIGLRWSTRSRASTTSPRPGVVRNADFVDTLGNVLGRPTIFPLPGVAVRLAWGEMGEEMLLGGQRVDSDKLQDEGFEFEHPELEGALRHVLGRWRFYRPSLSLRKPPTTSRYRSVSSSTGV